MRCFIGSCNLSGTKKDGDAFIAEHHNQAGENTFYDVKRGHTEQHKRKGAVYKGYNEPIYPLFNRCDG